MSKNIFIKSNFIKFFVFLSLFSLSFISFSFAQTSTNVEITNFSEIGTLITNLNKNVVQNLVVLLGGVALVVFLWGMVLFIYHRQKATIDQKDKEMMLWGLVGLFVFVSVWGIIKLFQGFLSVEGTDINLPRVCVNGSCGAGSGNPGVSELAALSGDKPFDQNKLITGDYDASKVALWKIDNNFKNNKTWVAQLQKFLTVQGYNLGVTGPNKDGVDGDFGTKTTEALKDFQRKNKLVDDGIVGESTKAVILYRYLNAPVTGDVYGTKNWSDISIGNGSASDITNLQKLLIDLGCYYGSASGTFDKATEDGVKLFQQKNYLVQDGIVGPSTRAVFLSPGTYSCK